MTDRIESVVREAIARGRAIETSIAEVEAAGWRVIRDPAGGIAFARHGADQGALPLAAWRLIAMEADVEHYLRAGRTSRLTAETEARLAHLRRPDEGAPPPQPVRGGQGRDVDDIGASAAAVAWCLIAGCAVLLAYAVAYALGWAS